MEGWEHQENCETVRDFVQESVGFRFLGSIMVGGFSALWINPFLGFAITASCVLGIITEFLVYKRFCQPTNKPAFPRRLALATFFNMSVFALPIPIVAMQGNLGLMFLAAIYACAGIIYPIIGYRSWKSLMVVAVVPYVVATALAAFAISHHSLAMGDRLSAILAIGVLPAYLCIAIAIYTPLENNARRQAELLDRANRERMLAQSANRAKSDFLAAMSHELRTPMNGVVGMAEMLKSTSLSPAQDLYTQVLAASGQTMMVLIDDILDMSSLDTGQVEISWEPFDLLALVEDTSILMAGRARAKGLDILVRIASDVPDRVVGDARHLRTVLRKLLDNAVKFTDEGHIIVGVCANTMNGKACLDLSVSDSGIGIDPNHVEDMFERFHQASMGIARRHDGLGLGLSICKSLTELMGGKISVETDPGAGSVFTISLVLPVAQDYQPISARLSDNCEFGLFGPTELATEFLAERIARMGGTIRHYKASAAGLLNVVADIRSGQAPVALIMDARLRFFRNPDICTALAKIPCALRPVLIRICDPDTLIAAAKTGPAMAWPVRTRDLHDALLLASRSQNRTAQTDMSLAQVS